MLATRICGVSIKELTSAYQSSREYFKAGWNVSAGVALTPRLFRKVEINHGTRFAFAGGCVVSQGDCCTTRALDSPPCAGRLERAVVGTLLWAGAVVVVLLIELSIGLAATSHGMVEKNIELVLGLTFLPVYFAVRHGWLKSRARLLPSAIDLVMRRHRINRSG